MEKNIIVFDGECNLCNGVVGWFLNFAPENTFSFVAFQSPKGQVLLKQNGFPTKQLNTVILFDDEGVHVHSDGFLRIAAKNPKWKKVAALFALVPKIIRDTVYKFFSQYRVQLFGQSPSCTISF